MVRNYFATLSTVICLKVEINITHSISSRILPNAVKGWQHVLQEQSVKTQLFLTIVSPLVSTDTFSKRTNAKVLGSLGFRTDPEVHNLGDLDVDKCKNGSVCDRRARCLNTPGGYDCICDHGFIGDGKACKRQSVQYQYSIPFAFPQIEPLSFCFLREMETRLPRSSCLHSSASIRRNTVLL